MAGGWIGVGAGVGVVNMINMDASMGAAICNFYTCIHVHAYMYVHVCMCVGHSMLPDVPHPSTPPQEPQGAQNIKIQ